MPSIVIQHLEEMNSRPTWVDTRFASLADARKANQSEPPNFFRLHVRRTPVESVDVDAANYEFTHGRRPGGYGSWAFGAQKNTRLEEMFWANGMTYGDAKRAAIKWAREKGFSVIYPQT